MRNAQLKIRKEVKHGTPYYVVAAPPSLSASKKYTRHYFRTKAEAERKRAELLAAIRNNTGPVLTEAQISDAHAALALLAENNLTANLVQAIKQALPTLMQQGCNITVEDLIERFISARSAAWRPSTTAVQALAQILGITERQAWNLHTGAAKPTTAQQTLLSVWHNLPEARKYWTKTPQQP